ncbi:NADP-dependent oxidoreductase [Novosphingobium sp. KCTC 2891]|uniref:NADP-dependent oxidoreductase n=1 Tax=Novosphingobium sp. KCTC 2891 TaxID=2989730 RepID=UPI0022226061|nr:NADP-dependent oxidoreductase [Novosphingobium sp. KCTC 2891]MCW1384480.1 NADP-dependent oxidoreductase [Novosphingobium sp. KCTC 2891]
MQLRNRQWKIAGRPVGRDVTEADFASDEVPARAPEAGEVLVRVDLLAFEPAMKGWMENIGGYVARTEIGDVMRGTAVGTVIESRADGFSPGMQVVGPLGWQDYAALPASDLRPVSNPARPSDDLGVLGLVGLTAYCGFKAIGQPFPGDTVMITGAAGAVGSVVAQIARIGGCQVIGVAGGPEKCRMLVEEYGLDAAIDYRAADFAAQVAAHAPNGIDVVWDNVGGTILNTLLGHLAMRARVVICGGISRSKTGGMPVGPENYFNLVFKRATMRGFILHDHEALFDEGRRRMAGWLAEGRLIAREDVQHGFDNAPRTLMRLFSGANVGKQLLRLDHGEEQA